MKQPLSINVITHEKFSDKEKYNDYIYSTFCKDIGDWLSRGINIPTFFYNTYNVEIDKEAYEKNIVVILIDDKMLLDKGCNNLSSITDDTDLDIISIAISRNAYKLSPFFTEQNLVRLYANDNNLDSLILDLAHFICKSMTEERQKVFISHAKLDGVDIASQLQQFISTESKLDSFFDAHNIQESVEWKKDIEDSIKESIVLVYYTDLYSTRLWCRKEILLAKKYDRPIVVINALEKKEERSFPYMANVPIVKVNDFSKKDFVLVLKNLLVETVRYYYYHKILDKFLKNNALENFTPIAFTPELLTLTNKNECENFMYPDPPLGIEELEVLNCFKKEIYFTPLTYLNKASGNRNLKVAISISESQDIESLGQRQYHLRSFIVELARYLLSCNMQLMYGGNIRYDKDFNFANIIAQLVMSYNEQYTTDAVIKNYTSYPFYEKIEDSIKTDLLDIVDFIDVAPDEKYTLNNLEQIERNYITAETLSKMRRLMNNDMDIKVVAGGKIEGFVGKYPGVLEEVYLALEDDKPIYLIGGFGGITKKIIDLFNGSIPKELSLEYQLEDKEFEKLYDYYKGRNEQHLIDYEKINNLFIQKGIEGLNNGLTIEENQRLFESKDIYEIVALIMKGLKNA